jgi:hypothetical protein
MHGDMNVKQISEILFVNSSKIINSSWSRIFVIISKGVEVSQVLQYVTLVVLSSSEDIIHVAWRGSWFPSCIPGLVAT